MKLLLVYGDPEQVQQSPWLRTYLSKTQPVGVISPEEILVPPGDVRLLLLEQATLPSMTAASLLLVLRGDCRPARFDALPSSSVMIVDSGNPHHRLLLSTFPGKVISFGRCQTDTVTFSSCGEEKAVVCLQRSIVTLDGRVIEPMEIPCQKPADLPEEALLEIVTVFLVLGISTDYLSLSMESP